MNRELTFLTLPDVALEKVLSFLSYDSIAKNRVVCKKFNVIGSQLLTRGFLQVEKRLGVINKKMKLMLPRRESERRAHSLAKHCDILSAIETRVSMLSMTYMKYIESNMCCFIPGKVIDEVIRILNLVGTAENLTRPPELLQELRDISSMAMEHFDEVILPKLKENITEYSKTNASTSKVSKYLVIQQLVSDEVHKLKKQSKFNKRQISSLVDILKKFNTKFKRQNNIIKEKSRIIREQERKLQEQAKKLNEQETNIAELKKHVDDWDQKFSDLTAELIRAREDFMLKSVTPPPISQLTPPQFLRTIIKPRTSLLKTDLPHLDFDRKRKSETNLEESPNKILKSTNISEDILTKINENITCNISKNIIHNFNKDNKSFEEKDNYLVNIKNSLRPFLSSATELLLHKPINSIKSRKRKMNDDINLK